MEFKAKSFVHCAYVLSLVLFSFLGIQDSVQGRLFAVSKPDLNNAAAYARWLVSQNFWGVLNTISSDLGGAPFGNVVSFSDGLPNKGGGIPFFYLTDLDPTARNAMKGHRSSLAISEYPIGTCGKKDHENPTCAKITLTGKLVLVDNNSKKQSSCKTLCSLNIQRWKEWPKDHNFKIFKLEVENIFLINWFGGARPLTVDQYLHPKMSNEADIPCLQFCTTTYLLKMNKFISYIK
ncbi:hypothetical protein Ddye_015026 [Dipteronia dyeriana]|uniref:CREG-like beta-barrel domain-containing protein n=1 Tax=Dipteronia dyeriana TaxID=168575 RepID=A0AAD9WYY3_9ROSI|nr:hypothetical protein Ddye_015026 [Dipteronia dyeriana]